MTAGWRLAGRQVWTSIVLALALTAPAASAQPVNPFADWIAVVVAADYLGADGKPAKVFDNARQDVTKSLVSLGFSADHIAQFSVRPHLYPDMPYSVSPGSVLPRELARLTGASRGGCFFFLTSHGDETGVAYGKDTLTPSQLDAMLDKSCGARPTVAIISACFSGVFVPALAAPNRMVVTAARADRSSFGCDAAEVYTYFDGCFLQSLPSSARLNALAENTRACVARREVEMGMTPPSEPQISIGEEMAARLPQLPLTISPPP